MASLSFSLIWNFNLGYVWSLSFVYRKVNVACNFYVLFCQFRKDTTNELQLICVRKILLSYILNSYSYVWCRLRYLWSVGHCFVSILCFCCKNKKFLRLTVRVECLMAYVKYKLVYSIFPRKRNYVIWLLILE